MAPIGIEFPGIDFRVENQPQYAQPRDESAEETGNGAGASISEAASGTMPEGSDYSVYDPYQAQRPGLQEAERAEPPILETEDGYEVVPYDSGAWPPTTGASAGSETEESFLKRHQTPILIGAGIVVLGGLWLLLKRK